MRFAVESWSPDYGVAADATQMEDATSEVDITVERAERDWQPIQPPPDLARYERVLFVDGVRRVDASIWFEDGPITRPGLCASVAAGSVLCTANEARVVETIIVRGFFARSSPGADSIHTAHGSYQYLPCSGDATSDLYLGIHEEMTRCESRLAADVDTDLVVYDGPLRGRSDQRAVGYVKTQQVQYLPDEVQPVLGQLGSGQRTPLFRIGGRREWGRFSWYLRLPGPRSQPLSGIVRLEMAASGTAGEAADRADRVTLTLPRFASEPHKDPRAPQNLYPIGGLEHRLRHLLGDANVLERTLRRSAGTHGAF